MQELRQSQNQDLRADPACNINSRKMESSPGDFPDLESSPGDFPDFRRLKAAENSSGLKGSEIL